MGLRRVIKNIVYKLKYNNFNSKIKTFSKKTVLVTGANSGIGLSLIKKLLHQKNYVLAIYNKNNDKLLQIEHQNLKIFSCNLSDLNEVEKISTFIKNISINIIINCAGSFGGNKQNFDNIDYENLFSVIKVNAVSCLKIAQIIIKNSKEIKLETIINISSHLASINENLTGGNYIYRISKTLMNSLSKNLSVDLKNSYKINVITIGPGSVRTKMNPSGLLTPELVADKIINILEDSTDKLNGKFIDLNKNIIQW